MVDKITSIEDLEQVRASAASQGVAMPNYNEWSQVMTELNEYGVESTGSYEGDRAKLKEVEQAVDDYIKQAQIEQVSIEAKKEDQRVKELPERDSEQTVKANVANATSSQLMADYMKIYHLLK